VTDINRLDLLKHPHSYLRGMWSALLATALFRCWHHILFFTAEAAIVTYGWTKDNTFKVDASMVTVRRYSYDS